MPVMSFVRFVDEDRRVAYGEPTGSLMESLMDKTIRVLEGDPFSGFKRTNRVARIRYLLCPLERAPIIYGIGYNYQDHATEAKLTISQHPAVITKPADALIGPISPIPIHPGLQHQLDYEGELCVIIGRDCKNVPEDEALDYVLGYALGNDLTCRYYQHAETSVGQSCYAKSFDGFAPIGPAIVSKDVIPDPQKLRFTTKVNGVVRQSASTDGMIWSVQEIIAHISRGTTLRRGTVIMTGTSSGVGVFMEPKGFLRDGDEVSIECEELGRIANKIIFEKQ